MELLVICNYTCTEIIKFYKMLKISMKYLIIIIDILHEVYNRVAFSSHVVTPRPVSSVTQRPKERDNSYMVE